MGGRDGGCVTVFLDDRAPEKGGCVLNRDVLCWFGLVWALSLSVFKLLNREAVS